MNFRPKKPAARIVPKPFGLINSVSLRSPKQSSTFPWCLIKTRLCKQVKYANSKTNMKTNHTLFPIVFKNLLFLYKLKLKITLSFIRSTHNKKGSTTPRHSQHQGTHNTQPLTTPKHSQHQGTHGKKAQKRPLLCNWTFQSNKVEKLHKKESIFAIPCRWCDLGIKWSKYDKIDERTVNEIKQKKCCSRKHCYSTTIKHPDEET